MIEKTAEATVERIKRIHTMRPVMVPRNQYQGHDNYYKY